MFSINQAYDYQRGVYDFAIVGDEMAKSHYHKLPVHADAYIRCGDYESCCPFHVKQENRMEEINHYFSK